MKQFNKENGEEVVYVQIKDIRFLAAHTQNALPKQVFKLVLASRDMDSELYIRFEDVASVSFFKEVNSIVDYGEAVKLSSTQIASIATSFVHLASDIARRAEKCQDLKNLSEEYEKCIHIASELQRLQAAKDAGTIEQLAFPSIPA